MLRVYRTELPAFSPRLLSRRALIPPPPPLPRESTIPFAPLARLCMPGTRLTHKLTLCPLHPAGPGNSSGRRPRTNPRVINLQVNSVCRDYHCYPESRRIRAIPGSAGEGYRDTLDREDRHGTSLRGENCADG